MNIVNTISIQSPSNDPSESIGNDIIDEFQPNEQPNHCHLSGDRVSLTPTDLSPNLIAGMPVSSGSRCNDDRNPVGTTKKRKCRSRSATKFGDEPELDLNQKTIEENYGELCRLLVSV